MLLVAVTCMAFDVCGDVRSMQGSNRELAKQKIATARDLLSMLNRSEQSTLHKASKRCLCSYIADCVAGEYFQRSSTSSRGDSPASETRNFGGPCK